MKQRFLHILIAARLPFLSVSVLPTACAVLYAWKKYGRIDPAAAAAVCFGIACAHAAANTLNDWHDWDRSDRINRRSGPFNGGSRRILENKFDRRGFLLLAGAFSLAAAACCLYFISQGLIGAIPFAAAAVFLGGAYSLPPVSLQARGLGEAAIGAGFGPVMTGAVGYVLTGRMTPEFFCMGIPFGFLTALIVWLNEIPDIEADRDAGKRTLVVRLGARRAAWGVPVLGCFFLGSGVLTISSGVFPLSLLAVEAAAVPALILISRAVVRYSERPEKLIPYQAGCILLHFLWTMGVCLLLAL